MAFRYQSLVLLAVLSLCYCGTIEKRSLDLSSINLDDVNVTVVENIVELVLESKGSSIDQVVDKVTAANGDVELIVKEFNAALGLDILEIIGNDVKLNSENVKSLLGDAIHVVVYNQVSNPILAPIVEATVRSQIDLDSQEINDLIENITLSVDDVKELLQNTDRSKRSLQARDFDLGATLGDLVANVLHGQLSSVITQLLETVKNQLLQLYSTNLPNDVFGRIVVFATNTLVNRTVAIINDIQASFTVSTTDNSSSTSSRRKRQTAVAADGLLDGLVRPVLNLLASVLSPVNTSVKNLTSFIFDLLRPILGNEILSRIQNIVYAIVDAILPAYPV